jgi:hypothetical protein
MRGEEERISRPCMRRGSLTKREEGLRRVFMRRPRKEGREEGGRAGACDCAPLTAGIARLQYVTWGLSPAIIAGFRALGTQPYLIG